jgi:sulfur carrier protein
VEIAAGPRAILAAMAAPPRGNAGDTLSLVMTLMLNGSLRHFEELEGGSTLEQMIQHLALKGDRIAVEHNGSIVPRASWSQTRVAENDRLEIVHFVGGG